MKRLVWVRFRYLAQTCSFRLSSEWPNLVFWVMDTLTPRVWKCTFPHPCRQFFLPESSLCQTKCARDLLRKLIHGVVWWFWIFLLKLERFSSMDCRYGHQWSWIQCFLVRKFAQRWRRPKWYCFWWKSTWNLFWVTNLMFSSIIGILLRWVRFYTSWRRGKVSGIGWQSPRIVGLIFFQRWGVLCSFTFLF